MRPREHPRHRAAGAPVRPRRRLRARRGGERHLSDGLDHAALLSAAAHDIRSPLAAAAGFALTLQRLGGLDERQSRFVEQIVAACEDIDRLVDDLSLLGRIGDGRLRPEATTVALAELAARAAEVAPPSTDGRRVTLGPPRTDGTVEADALLVARTIGRLAGLALRFDARGPGTVVAAVDGGVEIAPIGPLAAAELTGRERDLALAAARAALDALGWTLVVADGRAVVRPLAAPG